jgi:hypothetical protein
VFVYFSGLAYSVVVFGRSFGDFEGCARDHDVGSVGCGGPLLTVRAWWLGGRLAIGRVGGCGWGVQWQSAVTAGSPVYS